MDFSTFRIRKRARAKLTDILPQVPWFCASFCVFVGLQISQKLVDEQLTSNCQQLPKDKYTTKLHKVRWSGRKIFQTTENETIKGNKLVQLNVQTSLLSHIKMASSKFNWNKTSCFFKPLAPQIPHKLSIVSCREASNI